VRFTGERNLAPMGGARVTAAQRRIVRRISPAARKRIARLIPRRVLASYRHRRADVYLVSFPKCGRTWLRVMVGRVIQLRFGLPAGTDLVELHRLAELDPRIPCIVATHDDEPQWKAPDEVERDKSRYRDKRVILLVRDPRDVIVSLYHQRRGRHGGYTGTLDEFLAERRGGFESLLRFYGAWADNLDTPGRVLVVRYEDLHARPEHELRRVLDFTGLDGVDPAVVADAVAFGSFDHMRGLEEAGTFATEKLRPGRRGDLATYKTRRGQVGGYRDELTECQIARLDSLLAASAAGRFGYTVGR
jgi:Sulfotransferase domain